MLGKIARENLVNQTKCMSSEEQIAVAEGLNDDVLFNEIRRRYEEQKYIIKSVQDSFTKNMEGFEGNGCL